MSKYPRRYKYDSLSDQNIERAVSALDDFLSENGIDYEERTRHKQFLEEVLTEYASTGKDSSFWFIPHRSYRTIHIQIVIKGKSFHIAQECGNPATRQKPGNQTIPLKWKYGSGENRLSYTWKTVVPGKEALPYVIRYMGKEKTSFKIGVILRFVNMLFVIVDPLWTAQLVLAFNGSMTERILLFAVIIAIMDAASSLVTFIAFRMLTRAYTTMHNDLQSDLTKRILKIKTEHIESHGSGVFVQRIVDEADNLVDGIDKTLTIFTETFRMLGLLVATAFISVPMLFFQVILYAVYLIIVHSQAKAKSEDSRRTKRSKENLSSFVTEMIKACRDVKLLHCEDSFTEKANRHISNYTDRMGDVQNHNSLYMFARTQFTAWTNLFYILILVFMMTRFGLSAATALVLYSYNGKAYISARGISSAAEDFYSLVLSAENIYQLFVGKDFSVEEFGGEKLEAVQGGITLNYVRFGYSHENEVTVPVLKGMNISIEAGTTVALVGKSGCGKSTTLSLITRLYEPSQGEILLDGIDISGLDRDSLRGNIGMVSQSPYLFNMSIRDNFTVIKKDITEEEMIEACKTACIHDDIIKLASGYDTIAGEGGVMLSGGQRQRIALARCLIRDYPVIILDESTSALDNETQQKIQTAIYNMQGKTVIMVAHRLSTFINCDRLFYIENGKVLAAGTHSELLANCKQYQDLYGIEAAV